MKRSERRLVLLDEWVISPSGERRQVRATTVFRMGQRIYFYGGGSAWAVSCNPESAASGELFLLARTRREGAYK